MRRLLAVLFFFFLFPFFVIPVSAQEDSGWVIRYFQMNALIRQDGWTEVTETIMADFRGLAKHGIFREIPLEGLKIKFLEAKQDGVKVQTKITYPSGSINMRLGNPDHTISGTHTYEINYKVGGAVTRFSDHDEFYWDATGNNWPIAIENTAAAVKLEEGDVQKAACYMGAAGSQEQSCTSTIENGVAKFVSARALPPGEGLTVVNRIPKGVVAEPAYWEDYLKIGWTVLGTLGVFIFILRQWWKHGRDLWYKGRVIDNPLAEEGVKPLFGKQTVVAEFEPPFDLRPGEVGTLVDERIDMRDISATIVDLAVRGYLKIHEKKVGRKATYAFEKLKDFENDDALQDYEREILLGIFGGILFSAPMNKTVKLSELENKFYTSIARIKEGLYKRLTAFKFFDERPDKVQGKYLFKGILLSIGVWGVLISTGFSSSILWFMAPFAFLGILLAVFSFAMPKKTGKGTEAVRRAAGFKLFISTAQKYQQQFNERINRFDEFLPYAMVFGVADKWASAFAKLGAEPKETDWYSGTAAFSAANLSSSITSMENAFASALSSNPSGSGSGFGGGGSSGGGGGGGGGGSW